MSTSNSRKLCGKTIFITGGSRGIGKAIALRAARDGANVVIAAKTAEPHPKLPGTIYTAAKEVEDAGGRCLACVVDVRNEEQVFAAVSKAVKTFGGIDILVNNASAISLTPTEGTDMKRYDLMQQCNTRGTFLVSKVCLPYLKKGKNPHILNLSPPLNLSPMWFQNHLAYTLSKYGMTMCALGMAEEYRSDGIAVNTLWPKTTIKTAATDNLAGSEASAYSRTPEIMADAAYAILTKESRTFTGQFLVDEDVLRAEGMSQPDIDKYACDPSNKDNLMLDFFLEINSPNSGSKTGKSPTELDRVFAAIQSILSKELVDKIQCVFQFNLTGHEKQTWYLDLKNGAGSCGRGTAPSPPDATLATEDVYFCKLFSGNLRITAALMAKKLEVQGDLKKALKLEVLFGMLKSKL